MLHYTILKSKKKNAQWITLLHGIGAGSIVWIKQRKSFREHFNLILIDLPGHGQTKFGIKDLKNVDFFTLADQIDEVLQFENIKKTHIIGLSLGTLVAQTYELVHSKKIEKMVLCGAVESFNIITKIGLQLLYPFRHIIPYMTIFKLATRILVPLNSESESRNFFIQCAKKVGKREFLAWYKMRHHATKIFRKISGEPLVEKLYIMGESDHMFLPKIRKKIKSTTNTTLVIVKNAGHVCNIEKPLEFNKETLKYLLN